VEEPDINDKKEQEWKDLNKIPSPRM